MSYWRNNKSQTLYKVLDLLVVNATNAAHDEIMVLYKNSRGRKFVREAAEFKMKFTETNETQWETHKP